MPEDDINLKRISEMAREPAPLERVILVASDSRDFQMRFASLGSGQPGELVKAFEDMAKRLSGREGWVLVGGLALGLYSQEIRTTRDIDIIITSDNLRDLLFALTASQVGEDRAPFKKASDHRVVHRDTGVEVELLTPDFVNNSPDLHQHIIRNAEKQRFGQTQVPVVSAPDFVALKLMSGRKNPKRKFHDFADVQRALSGTNISDQDIQRVPGIEEQDLANLEEIRGYVE